MGGTTDAGSTPGRPRAVRRRPAPLTGGFADRGCTRERAAHGRGLPGSEEICRDADGTPDGIPSAVHGASSGTIRADTPPTRAGAPACPAGPAGAPDRMISTGELRKGVVIELDGDLWQILDYHHIKMGRGSAQVRIKLRNVKKGSTVEKSFQAGEKWPRAQLDRREIQFLYRDGDDFHFMEMESYEQFHLTANQIDDIVPYLKDGMTLDRISYEGETLGVELPITVDLVVSETEPGYAGDTATGARKAATMETGLVVSVPLFVQEGDTLRIDTRTGEYQTRL